MNRQEEIRSAVFYALIVIVTCIALGAILVVFHELVLSSWRQLSTFDTFQSRNQIDNISP